MSKNDIINAIIDMSLDIDKAKVILDGVTTEYFGMTDDAPNRLEIINWDYQRTTTLMYIISDYIHNVSKSLKELEAKAWMN